jgi:hypothetical protein
MGYMPKNVEMLIWSYPFQFKHLGSVPNENDPNKLTILTTEIDPYINMLISDDKNDVRLAIDILKKANKNMSIYLIIQKLIISGKWRHENRWKLMTTTVKLIDPIDVDNKNVEFLVREFRDGIQ